MPEAINQDNPENQLQSIPQPAPQSELFPNLAKKMDDEYLEQIGRMVCEGYDNDETSREDFMAEYKDWIRLSKVHPEHKKKSSPWEDAANIVIPMISIACIQFQSRAEDALFSTKDIVKAVPIGYTKEDSMIATRVAKDMNFQLDYEMPNFHEGMSYSLMNYPLVGTTIRKTYYDELQKTNVSDFINLENICVNYWTRYIESAPRITQVLYMQQDEINNRKLDGIFLDIDLINTSSVIDEGYIKESFNEINGLAQPEADETTPRKILEQHTKIKIKKNDKKTTPVVVFVDYETKKVLRIVSRINPYKKEPKNVIHYFTKYGFIPSPDGSFYDLGFGSLLKRSNETINTLINQLTDAGTLSNRQGGFVLTRSGIPRGSLSFKMGEYKEVDLRSSDDIRKVIMNMPTKEPSQVLFQLLGLLQDYANRVTTVSEAMTGDMPRSGVGSMGVVNLLEQGLKVFSSIFKRLHRSFKKEVQKLYDLNGIYRDEEEYLRIVANSDLIPMELARQIVSINDYRRPLDVQPVSDPNIISKSEKAAKSQAIYQTIIANPLFGQNPE